MDSAKRRAAGSFAALAVAAGLVAAGLDEYKYVPLDDPAIRYSSPPNDPVAQLEKRLEKGQAKLDFAANGLGYLPSVLQQLGIRTDSQVLVFSKTSIQTAHIAPRTPRAIYFNDEVSVGYVQNGDVLELSALDPRQGVVMYSLDAGRVIKPEFSRRDDCLRCHQGPPTLGVPGILVSSVHPKTGEREPHGNSYVTDQRIGLDQRWGGWYVTGTHGKQTHLGNNLALVDPLQPGGPAGEESQNVKSLGEFFDTSRYLEPTSDIVALMTLEHQTRMTNLLIRIGWDARINPRDTEQMNAEVEELLKYMLFTDEALLQEPVAGVSTFARTFAERGPRDSQGRSLRDFDLQTRLFRYPLSYMIYSAAFDGLPDAVRARIYQRLYDILSGKDQSEAFARLTPETRLATLEIVRATKKGLPAYWAGAATPGSKVRN